MKDQLLVHQQVIQEEIRCLLTSAQQEFHQFALDDEQFSRVTAVATKGKQFRGCLLVAWYLAVSDGRFTKQAITLAAAVELYGTALLIQDDIMDEAEERRGLSAIHRQFTSVGFANEFSEADRFGEGVAMCLADVLFFIAQQAVDELDLPAELIVKISKINARELALLGLAQVEDLRLARSTKPVSKAEIESMYIGKTGRYTGRWPLELACILVDLSEEETEKISKLGEKIGLLYQLIDDKLGIFGNAQKTGKSTASDITEGKKTLYYFYLQEKLSPSEKGMIFKILGNSHATKDEVELVKQLILTKQIDQQVSLDIEHLSDKVKAAIAELTVSDNSQQLLHAVVRFVVERQK